MMAIGTNRQRVESFIGSVVHVQYKERIDVLSHTGVLRGVDGRLAQFDEKGIWIPNIVEIKPAG